MHLRVADYFEVGLYDSKLECPPFEFFTCQNQKNFMHHTTIYRRKEMLAYTNWKLEDYIFRI